MKGWGLFVQPQAEKLKEVDHRTRQSRVDGLGLAVNEQPDLTDCFQPAQPVYQLLLTSPSPAQPSSQPVVVLRKAV